MWVKLGSEFLNLSQVLRVRFSKGFRAGQEEWAAEVETMVHGELQIVTRYRGAEALHLRAVLNGQTTSSSPETPALAAATTNTLHDLVVR